MSACAGVLVVVDSHPGVREVCDAAGGGQDAATLFARNGWKLTPVTSDPSFVCRVGGQPADAACGQTPPANAYWSLWISTGPGQPWTYATLGAYSLTVPKGGSVAFSWDDRPGNIPPSVPPAGQGSATATPSPFPAATAAPSAAPSPAAPSAAAPSAAAPSAAAPSAAAPGPSAGGGVPGWVAPGVVVLLLVVAVAAALVRRRRGTGRP